MFCIICICFWTVLNPAIASEGNESETERFKTFCEKLDLDVGVYADSERCVVRVYFELTDFSYIDCFEFFNISLKRDKEEIDHFKVKLDGSKGNAFHEFQNVTSGVYKIFITTSCTHRKCSTLKIEYGPLINISSDICISNRNETYRTSFVRSDAHISSVISNIHSTPLSTEVFTPSIYEANTSLTDTIYKREHKKYDIKQKVVIITIGISTFFLLIFGLIYLARRKKHSNNLTPGVTPDHEDNKIELENTDIDIEVYIFHFYDSEGMMKKKVEVVKDFLHKLSYFSCVKGIEDELAVILFNVNNWLNDVLDEGKNYGTAKRVILITSKEENEFDDDAIENQIYSAFLKKINNKSERCFTGDDNIHFVQLDNHAIHSVRFENIIWQHQYSLCGESNLEHMIDLCLNLCSGLNLDKHLIERRIRELFRKHPVRHFGNYLELVECV